MGWKHFQDLIVWQKSMELVDEIYHLTRLLPRDEIYSLSNQMRRAAISVPSNIAEGHGRQTDKEFKQFLSIGRGSLYELETQIYICIRQNYFPEEQANTALNLCRETGKMLTKLLTSSSEN